jgi:hypothetical protein
VHLEPNVLLPTQLRRAGIARPEERLLLAVLEEAVGTYQRYLVEADHHSRAVFAEVEAWFASEDGAWIYSFVAICDSIGLDPAYIRSGLGSWTDMQRSRLPETAPSSYGDPFRRMNGARHRANARPTGQPRVP